MASVIEQFELYCKRHPGAYGRKFPNVAGCSSPIEPVTSRTTYYYVAVAYQSDVVTERARNRFGIPWPYNNMVRSTKMDDGSLTWQLLQKE